MRGSVWVALALLGSAACAKGDEAGAPAAGVGAVAQAPATAAAAPAAAAPAVELQVDGQGVRERAKVTDEAARATALAAVPGGAIAAAELEDEGGLIYSYDVKVAGKDGVEEVHVDAITGKLLSVEHEGAAAEADEAKEPGETRK